MAYFSNGCEGEKLHNQCAECIHSDPEAGCPVALVQSIYNYDQLKEGNKQLNKAMSILINDDGICQMKIAIDKYIRKV